MGLQAFRPPTAAQAAEAALNSELPAVAGLGPASAAAQADVDAFLRGLPGRSAGLPAEFAEFEGIYAQQRPPPGMPPVAAMPPLAVQGRAAAAPMLQVGGWMVDVLCTGRLFLLHSAAVLALPCPTLLCCLPPTRRHF